MFDADSSSPSVPRTILLGLALILSGVLLGVLAAKYMPIGGLSPQVANNQLEATPTITTIISPTTTPEFYAAPLVPTATPSALLNLRWNLLTTKSPISIYQSYKLHYPTTWIVKSQKINKGAGNVLGSSALLLTKGKTVLSILQNDGDSAGCLYPVDSDQDGIFQRYDVPVSLKKNSLSWRWAKMISESQTGETYYVCEQKPDSTYSASTTIGFISLSGPQIDDQTLDEFNLILEKLQIIPQM